ncbi:MAG: hypothetical protein GTN38_01175 [Candidatus Aenigmarchaeota archaeon]|nr:hypothetical protein [Candidatus Aenigmarchaeota archaeon]NIP40255.1 hypothetical protein [Candidatus Aenigmarchaeota archaeon]NIQ17573.1 hypothetical protein [Candidatus Aenigmarchaeota archaeon]
MALHFPREHSHRWADHVLAWSEYLGDSPYDGERVFNACYERKELPKDEYRNNYTPLMTSLLYGLFMNEKMGMGTEFLRNLFGDEPFETKIKEETNKMMEYFLSDAHELLKGTKYSSTALTSTPGEVGNILNGFIDFDEGRKNVLRTRPTPKNVEDRIKMYILSRFAQEYFTLEGAVITYHHTIKYGRKRVGKAIRENSEALACMINRRLFDLKKTAGFKSSGEMETDHVIKRNKWGNEIHTMFFNCPIYGAYKTVDEKLGEYYGEKAGLTEGGMDHCQICIDHGKQSVILFPPWFLNIDPRGRTGKPVSAGGNYCDFTSKVTLNPLKRKIRKIGLKRMLRNPPEIRSG